MEPVTTYQPRRRSPMLPRKVRIGVDVGQTVDPTAICVVELQPHVSARLEDQWDRWGERQPLKVDIDHVVRMIERVPLRTPYPKIAERIVEVVDRVSEMFRNDRQTERPELLIDATGVGRPVVDLIRHPLRDRDVRTYAVTFTATDRIARGHYADELRMGKAHMVSRMTALFQQGRVFAPDLPSFRALADELADYEIRVTGNAHATAGAFKAGSHDDLATALGLALVLPYHSGGSVELIDL